mmetsp:Transcript_72410/g.223738  ORF Transcript_72410/g.223738 Transcript_72410/m.223738 type:complete len:88 (-) Transcript_72410:53-316(-)
MKEHVISITFQFLGRWNLCSWARYFMDVSFPQEDWLVTEAEMYGAGVKFVEHGLCVPEPWHDWSEARAEWERAQGAIDQKKKNRKAG